MENKFKNRNKNKIKKLDLNKKNITIKNFPKKPSIGGIPAKDKKIIIINIVKNGILKKPFNSFKVLKYLKSNKKKIKNIVINNKI